MPGLYPNRTVVPTIPAGQAVSQAVCVQGKLSSIQIPSNWTAASITFQGSPDGVTYSNIFDGFGNEVTIQGLAGQMVAVDDFDGATFMIFRSGTSASPVNQVSAATLIALVRKDPIPSRW